MYQIEVKDQHILLLSDTHGMHHLVDIPDNIQIVIHAGDVCNGGDFEQIKDFFNWFASLDIRHKIFVHGNHDLPFELEPETSKELIPRGVRWLNNTTVHCNGVSIRGINVDFLSDDQLEGTTCDILISHYPPAGIMDGGIGMMQINEYVHLIKPKYCTFGHCHEKSGIFKRKGTTFINASLYQQLLDKEK